MKVVLVDCLIYQGLLCYQRRRAAGSPDRDEPITTRMKRAEYTSHPAFSRGARMSPDLRTAIIEAYVLTGEDA